MRFLSLAAVVFLVCAGCGGGSDTMRVWGDVSYEGIPVPEGTIEFTPMEGSNGPSTGGVIKDGRYDVPAKVGPLPGGTYKVAITAMSKTGKTAPDPANPAKKIDLIENVIPANYSSKTTLTVTIATRASANKHDFHLK